MSLSVLDCLARDRVCVCVCVCVSLALLDLCVSVCVCVCHTTRLFDHVSLRLNL